MNIVMQVNLFIIYGVCGLIVQTLLLRLLLGWFQESRVLVIGESLTAPLRMCSTISATSCADTASKSLPQLDSKNQVLRFRWVILAK